jgi:hypothetical protein
MKRWEIILYLLLFSLLISKFFPNSELLQEWSTRRITFSILAFFSYQQYKKCRVVKWQTRILYLVQVYLVVFAYPISNVIVMSIHAVVLLLVTLLLISTLIFPIPVLPIPVGPHPVGTTKLVFHQGDLHVPCKIWYPTESKYCLQSNRDLYFDEEYVGPFSFLFDIPRILIHYFSSIKSHSFLDAPLSVSQERWPILLFSHGLYGIPELYTLLCENMASFGYVVFAPYHTDGSALHLEYPNNKYVKFKPIPKGTDPKVFRTNQLNQRIMDMSCIIKKIQDKSIKPMVEKCFYHQMFDGRLDPDHISIFGHSFGGITAVATSCTLNSILSVISLDGWYEMFDIEEYTYSVEWQGKMDKIKLKYMMEQCPNGSYSFTISESKHQNFSDLTFIIPAAKRFTNMLGKVNGWNALVATIKAMIQFLNNESVPTTTTLIKEF